MKQLKNLYSLVMTNKKKIALGVLIATVLGSLFFIYQGFKAGETSKREAEIKLMQEVRDFMAEGRAREQEAIKARNEAIAEKTEMRLQLKKILRELEIQKQLIRPQHEKIDNTVYSMPYDSLLRAVDNYRSPAW
jgi:hypothetical protein